MPDADRARARCLREPMTHQLANQLNLQEHWQAIRNRWKIRAPGNRTKERVGQLAHTALPTQQLFRGHP